MDSFESPLSTISLFNTDHHNTYYHIVLMEWITMNICCLPFLFLTRIIIIIIIKSCWLQGFLWIYFSAYNPKSRIYLRRTKMASGKIDPRRHKFWPCAEFLKEYVQKTYRQQYYLSTLPRPLTPFIEERWSKFYSLTAYQNKASQP